MFNFFTAGPSIPLNWQLEPNGVYSTKGYHLRPNGKGEYRVYKNTTIIDERELPLKDAKSVAEIHYEKGNF